MTRRRPPRFGPAPDRAVPDRAEPPGDLPSHDLTPFDDVVHERLDVVQRPGSIHDFREGGDRLMARRIRWFGVAMIICFCGLLIQLDNIQGLKASQYQNACE